MTHLPGMITALTCCLQTLGAVLEGSGRVSYEQSGEHFFQRVNTQDQVSFYVATDKRYTFSPLEGNLWFSFVAIFGLVM